MSNDKGEVFKGCEMFNNQWSMLNDQVLDLTSL